MRRVDLRRSGGASAWRRWLTGYAAALVGVTEVSLLIGLVLREVNLANISMLYLLAVMAAAIGFGRGPAIFASVSAFLIFDWFFVEPGLRETRASVRVLQPGPIRSQIGLAHERARLRQEATEAEILRRTDELRSALLSAVPHDLRTPLATIMAFAGSLRQQDIAWTDEERVSFAQAIEEDADRLNHLVGNLLDLSRIEGGSLKPQKSWQALDAVITDTVDRLRPVTRAHRVRVAVPHDLPPMWFDPVVGPGIPALAIPHLFDPFYRGGARFMFRMPLSEVPAQVLRNAEAAV